MSITSTSSDQFLELPFPNVFIVDFTLDENLPPLAQSSQAKRNSALPSKAYVDRNSLNVLPLEVLHLMISHLDLRTLANFQRACRSTQQFVESHLQYQTIITHARSALRGSLAIGTGQWITCEMLYMTLCTADCEQCGDFGGYIYILTCKRVCFRCFTEQTKYLPLSYSHAIRIFGLSRRALDTLPQMKSLPGTYSPFENLRRKRLTLIDYASAQEAGINTHGSLSSIKSYISNIAHKKAERSQKSKNPTSSESILRRMSTSPFDGTQSNPLRYMAVVKAPWFNRTSLIVEPAYYCIGCESIRRLLTVHLFDAHLREYGNIIHKKHQLGRHLEAL